MLDDSNIIHIHKVTRCMVDVSVDFLDKYFLRLNIYFTLSLNIAIVISFRVYNFDKSLQVLVLYYKTNIIPLNTYIFWSWLRRKWNIRLGWGLDRKTWLIPARDVTSHGTGTCITVVPFQEGLASLVGFTLVFTIFKKKNIQNSLNNSFRGFRCWSNSRN